MRTFIFSKVGGQFAPLAAAGMLLISSPSGHAGGTVVERDSNCTPGWTAEFPSGHLSGSFAGIVTCLKTMDAGDGPALYVGGTFERAGGLAANHIALGRPPIVDMGAYEVQR